MEQDWMIYLDSWVWLELFLNGEKFERCKSVLVSIQNGKGAVISAITLAEVKYKIAKKKGITPAVVEIELIESFPNLLIVPVNSDVAKLAADLRLKYYSQDCEMSYADAIHLATAVLARCTCFYTGDPDFKDVKELPVVII